jgi:hypothetical protein
MPKEKSKEANFPSCFGQLCGELAGLLPNDTKFAGWIVQMSRIFGGIYSFAEVLEIIFTIAE